MPSARSAATSSTAAVRSLPASCAASSTTTRPSANSDGERLSTRSAGVVSAARSLRSSAAGIDGADLRDDRLHGPLDEQLLLTEDELERGRAHAPMVDQRTDSP